MKHTLRRCFLLCTAAFAVVGAAVAYASRAVRWLFDANPFTPQSPEPVRRDLPAVELVRASAFKLSLIKRDIMEMRPGYRRCPSI